MHVVGKKYGLLSPENINVCLYVDTSMEKPLEPGHQYGVPQQTSKAGESGSSRKREEGTGAWRVESLLL